VPDNPQRKNVLIVEDDPDIRAAVAEILTMEGYSVTEASNGLVGLNRLAQMQRPCIILLDMMMPVMDGQEFLTRLQADPELRGCTVLIVTASFVQLPPGAAGVLRKPYELSELLDLLERHCP